MAEQENDMSFLDHLEELRFRLIRAVIAIVVAATVLFTLKSVMEAIIFGPLRPDFISYQGLCWISGQLGLGEKLCIGKEGLEERLQFIKIGGAFLSHVTTSLIGGIILAFPFVFYQIWAFIKPGLRAPEVKATRGVILFVSLLFGSGVAFGYFVLCPLSTQFFLGYSFLAETKPDVRSYIKLVTAICLATGLIFQLPMLVYFLARIGLVTGAFLKKYRRHALVVVLVVSAVITPPDVTSQVLVAFPVLLLYELSIVIAKRVAKKREAAMAE